MSKVSALGVPPPPERDNLTPYAGDNPMFSPPNVPPLSCGRIRNHRLAGARDLMRWLILDHEARAELQRRKRAMSWASGQGPSNRSLGGRDGALDLVRSSRGTTSQRWS